MTVAVVLGVTREVLESLTLDMDSLGIVLMIYASFPLFAFLLLWPGNKSRTECWALMIGGLLVFGCAVYSWTMVVVVDAGAMPALIMVWYGMLQTAVVAGLFIVLALIRSRHQWQAG